jgi:hypothetical protein
VTSQSEAAETGRKRKREEAADALASKKEDRAGRQEISAERNRLRDDYRVAVTAHQSKRATGDKAADTRSAVIDAIRAEREFYRARGETPPTRSVEGKTTNDPEVMGEVIGLEKGAGEGVTDFPIFDTAATKKAKKEVATRNLERIGQARAQNQISDMEFKVLAKAQGAQDADVDAALARLKGASPAGEPPEATAAPEDKTAALKARIGALKAQGVTDPAKIKKALRAEGLID